MSCMVSLNARLMETQEDETELSRRKDLEEDLDVDVFTPDDSVPRRPQPIITVPASLAQADSEDTDEGRAVRMAQDVLKWVDEEPDDDTWEGFFLSLDLLDTGQSNGVNGG